MVTWETTEKRTRGKIRREDDFRLIGGKSDDGKRKELRGDTGTQGADQRRGQHED